MICYFLTETGLQTLKSNLSSYLPFYKNDTNRWISEELGFEPFLPYKQEFEDFTLNPTETEIYNAKILFTALKSLSPSDAVEERFWAGLAHSNLWDYMLKSSELSLEQNSRLTLDESFVMNRYFFNLKKNGHKRSVYINALSKLWWAGKLTYNEDNPKDPFKYLQLFDTAFSHKLINTFSSNFMANKAIRFSLFEAGMYLKQQGISIKGDTLVPLLKYLNELGGSMILDTLSREELQSKLIRYAKSNLDEIKER